MEKGLYLSKDVSRYCDIPKRRVLHWGENKLIEAEEEAISPGQNRRYSYLNLLEFGLAKELFKMGFGVYAVRTMLKDLRTSGEIKAWAQNYDDYFLRTANDLAEIFEGDIPLDLPHGLRSQYEIMKDPQKMVEWLKPKKPFGILLYFFETEKRSTIVLPFEIEKIFTFARIKSKIIKCEQMVMINLGRIKRRIDRNIDKLT